MTAIMQGTKYATGHYNRANGGITRDVRRVFREGSKNQVSIQILGDRASNPFKKGQRIYLKTPKYNVDGTIWYIWYGKVAEGPAYNLYINVDYPGYEDRGGVVSNQPVPAAKVSEPTLPDQQRLPEGTPAPGPLAAATGMPVGKLLLIAGILVAGVYLFKRFGGKKKGK